MHGHAYRRELRAGAAAVAPMLVGVIPFGLVAGATPVTHGLGLPVALGFSTIVFAGASQLAALDVLTGGGSALVAAVAAWTINLRMLLYSASLAPHFAEAPRRKRALVAYLLTDQAFAVSITRWREDPSDLDRRFAYYLGSGISLWIVWVLSTLIGGLVGNAVPESAQLDFAVPLVFLVLLVPTLVSRSAVIAAAVGGGAAVVGAEAGAGHLSILVGAVAGILAGAWAEGFE
jgi:4-azaleucine resistance transporter AzlC